MPDPGLMDGTVSQQYQRNTPGSYSMYDRELPAIYIVKFEHVYKPDPNDPQTLKDEHWVEWGKPGLSNWSTRQRINQIRPRPEKGKPASIEWEIIGPAYEAWLKGEEVPIDGTPLHAWPGLPREAADVFKGLHVLTVEQLAHFPDDRLSKIPFPAAREWKRRALAYCEAMGAQSATGLGDAIKKRDDAIDRLEADNKAKDEMLASLEARLASLEGNQPKEELRKSEPPRRGPGRPRKVTEEIDGDAEPGPDA